MNKKFFMAAIVATTVATGLFGCGDANGSVAISAEEISGQAAADASSSARDNVFSEVSEEESAVAASTDAGAVAVPSGKDITVVDRKITSEDGGKVYAEGIYPEIVLSDEYKGKYPKLDEYINGFNTQKKESASETTDSDAEHAKGFDDIKFTNSENVEIVRADDKMFSFVIDKYWEAGAHPDSYVDAINVDPSTGQELELKQVLNDTSDLKSGIIEKIKEKYPNLYEEFVENQEDLFLAWLEPDMNLEYSITEKGLNIYFDEVTFSYMSMPDDGVEITLPYGEYPNLIKQEYALDKAQNLDEMVEYIRSEAE